MMPPITSILFVVLMASGPLQEPDSSERPVISPVDLVSALEDVVTSAIETARPSVVTIDRLKSEDGTTTAVRGLRPPNPRALVLGNDLFSEDYFSNDFSSGVVIGDQGEILTCAHVVLGASRLIVRAEGIPPFTAVILALDPRSDLAVIAPETPILNEEGLSQLKAIKLAETKSLSVGSFLVALGNPYNVARDGRASASFGILANTSRRLLPFPDRNSPRQLQHYSTLYQLDSKLNLGMSGGAVVNLRGELVAITTARAEAVGFDPRAGYAIPVSDPLGSRIVLTLRDGKEVAYGFLGISLMPPSNAIATVERGTPADRGGLLTNDRVVEVGGIPVQDFDSLIRAVNASPVGELVALTIERNGERQSKEVILSKFPVRGEVIATNRPAPWRGLRVDYPSVNADRFGLGVMASGGVSVTEVGYNSPAEQGGLRTGMVITEVNDKPVNTPEEFRDRVTAEGNGPVNLRTNTQEVITIPDEGSPTDDD